MSLVRVVGRSVVVRHLARALVELFAVSLIAFAVTELAPGDAFGQARLERQLSPAAVDALRSRAGLDRPFLARYAAPLARPARAGMPGGLRAPYLVAAAARGIPYRRLLWRSALRAAANPLVSLFGLSFAALFSASMIVEVVMSWPGLGPMLLDAVRSRDEPLVLAGVMLSTVLLLLGNGCADVLLRAVDPRIAA